MKPLALFGLLLLLPFSASASVIYSRLPEGTDIISPVSVSVMASSTKNDFFSGVEDFGYWAVKIVDYRAQMDSFSPCIASTTNEWTGSFDLPQGYEAMAVQAVSIGKAWGDAYCSYSPPDYNAETFEYFLEGENTHRIFLVSAPPTALDLWNGVASTTASAFGASWELIVLVLGSMLVLFFTLGIITAILKSFRRM